MPRKRRRPKKRLQHGLTPNGLAWFRGEEGPPPGEEAGDYGWVQLEYLTSNAEIADLWEEVRKEIGGDFPQTTPGQCLFLRRQEAKASAAAFRANPQSFVGRRVWTNAGAGILRSVGPFVVEHPDGRRMEWRECWPMPKGQDEGVPK